MSDGAVQSDLGGQMQSLNVGEMQAVLRDRNPQASPSDLRAVAVLAAQAVDFFISLTPSERLGLVREPSQVRAALEEAAHHGKLGDRSHIEPTGRRIKSQGAGLGERVPLDDGRAQLEHYATPGPIERWAGAVVGAGEIETRLGVRRSTLNAWVKRGTVVGLLRGERKLAYPLVQFVDNRPLEGLADVLRLAPNARGAWLWLRQPNGALDGETPLERLRAGDKAAVVRAAQADLPLERDFA
jgi:hypothetical protein